MALPPSQRAACRIYITLLNYCNETLALHNRLYRQENGIELDNEDAVNFERIFSQELYECGISANQCIYDAPTPMMLSPCWALLSRAVTTSLSGDQLTAFADPLGHRTIRSTTPIIPSTNPYYVEFYPFVATRADCAGGFLAPASAAPSPAKAAADWYSRLASSVSQFKNHVKALYAAVDADFNLHADGLPFIVRPRSSAPAVIGSTACMAVASQLDASGRLPGAVGALRDALETTHSPVAPVDAAQCLVDDYYDVERPYPNRSDLPKDMHSRLADFEVLAKRSNGYKPAWRIGLHATETGVLPNWEVPCSWHLGSFSVNSVTGDVVHCGQRRGAGGNFYDCGSTLRVTKSNVKEILERKRMERPDDRDIRLFGDGDVVGMEIHIPELSGNEGPRENALNAVGTNAFIIAQQNQAALAAPAAPAPAAPAAAAAAAVAANPRRAGLWYATPERIATIKTLAHSAPASFSKAGLAYDDRAYVRWYVNGELAVEVRGIPCTLGLWYPATSLYGPCTGLTLYAGKGDQTAGEQLLRPRLAGDAGFRMLPKELKSASTLFAARARDLYYWLCRNRLHGCTLPFVTGIMAPNHKDEEITEVIRQFDIEWERSEMKRAVVLGKTKARKPRSQSSDGGTPDVFYPDLLDIDGLRVGETAFRRQAKDVMLDIVSLPMTDRELYMEKFLAIQTKKYDKYYY